MANRALFKVQTTAAEIGVHAEHSKAGADAGCEDELKAENQLLRQQLAQADATRAHLETCLVAAQQDHRLLLQKVRGRAAALICVNNE